MKQSTHLKKHESKKAENQIGDGEEEYFRT